MSIVLTDTKMARQNMVFTGQSVNKTVQESSWLDVARSRKANQKLYSLVPHRGQTAGIYRQALCAAATGCKLALLQTSGRKTDRHRRIWRQKIPDPLQSGRTR